MVGDQRNSRKKHTHPFRRLRKSRAHEQIGDLLFAVVNLARKSQLDAETLLQEGTNKFVRRFNTLEDEVRARGKKLGDLELEALDEIWNAQKAQLRG